MATNVMGSNVEAVHEVLPFFRLRRLAQIRETRFKAWGARVALFGFLSLKRRPNRAKIQVHENDCEVHRGRCSCHRVDVEQEIEEVRLAALMQQGKGPDRKLKDWPLGVGAWTGE